jgi:succinyl-CoA synthetase beta subunit
LRLSSSPSCEGWACRFFRSPERALRALARLASLPTPRPGFSARPAFEPTGSRLQAGVIPEYLAKRLLAEVGIPFPRAELVSELRDALGAAARIGYPVALKAQSSSLTHKSDAGGVVLGLADDAALAEAWRKLHFEVAKARPDLRLDGILVEGMVRPGTELILGVRSDPDWGPVLLIGLGGVWAEVLQDVRVLPPDLEPAAIVGELRKLKAGVLMTGFRGAPALDLGAIAEIASRLGRFVAARPEIAEIDVNPLVVYPDQEGVIAVDALIVVR